MTANDRPPIPDQRAHWDRLHADPRGRLVRDDPSWFARRSAPLFPPAAALLELGCGAGQDALWFASLGHRVIATDFSETAISTNRARHPKTVIDWRILDIAEPLPFGDASFDIVYAYLSLHYFSEPVTRQIFARLHRVLRPGGLLCFCCKSTADPLHGRGDLIEPDVYLHRGHLRHFFSEPYTRSCLSDIFTIDHLDATPAYAVDPLDDFSAFLAVIARAV